MCDSSRARRRAWWWVGGWLITIVIASSIPNPPPAPTSIIPVDKVVHFTEYFVLGALLLRATLISAWKCALPWTLAITVSFAFVDEAHQYFIPSRVPDLADASADCAGAAIGALCFLIFRQRSQPEKPQP